VSQLIEQYNIDCEFKRGNLHVASKAKETADLQAEVDHLQQVYDYQQIRYVDKSELAQMTCGQGFHGGTVDTGARHLHPLNYALGLARRLIRDDTSMSDTLFVINYWKLSADIKNFVRKCMLRIYPELAGTRIDYGWGGTLAITMNRMPDFGRLSANVFYAQGFSGHGVPTATMAGKLLAEVISGTAERFDIMATVPSPTFPGGTLLRWPGQVTGMLFYSLRDRLG
jgi:glycine/D-amino acid oxidase-like deaminating enzyme